MTPKSFSAQALLAVLFVLSATAGSAFAGTVSGTIRSAETGQPLGSKVVAAYDTTGTLRGSATSDQTGSYSLTLPAGDYRVLAYDPEGVYATMFDANAESFEATPVTAVGATGTVNRDFSLVTGGYITGVVAGPTGSPLAGATVEAYNLSGTRRTFTTTNAQGSYLLVVPPGEYKVIAYDPSGVASFSFYRNASSFADSSPVSVAASRTAGGINFNLLLAARLSGTVLDATNNTVLGGMTVYVYTPSGSEVGKTTTDQAGAFRFSVPPGDYKLVAADPARRFAPAVYGGLGSFFELGGTVGVRAGEDRSGISISMTRGATIAGRVVDSTGAPVANVSVAAYAPQGWLHTTAVTDAQGRYELLVVPGTYRLAAFDPQLAYATSFLGGVRYFASSGTLAIVTGQQLGGFDFTLVRGGRISGTVRDGSQPRANITVAAYDAAGIFTASAVTNATGAYSFAVPPGDYRIVAFESGFDPLDALYAPSYDLGAPSFDQTVPRSVAAGASIVADIALRRGRTITGAVHDPSGEFGVAGVNVFALDAAGNRVAGTTTFGDGEFSLTVPAGAYKFVFIDPAGRYAVTYYDRATTLAAATWVTVPENLIPPRLQITLEAASPRRRATRH